MMMTDRSWRSFAAAVAVLLAPSGAWAQQSVSDVLGFLVTNQSVATGSFERDRAAADATSATISRALLANLATLPVTTSSGGFVYRLNPELGTVERASPSFGPFFVERALTAGSRTASVGFTYQHMRFNALDGRELRDGTLVTTANQFVDEAEPFDVDRLALFIDADVATLYGNVGLGDSVEIGAAVPLVSLRLEGSRVNTYRGRTFTQATASATAVGLADMVVRTKVTLFERPGFGFAAATDIRLPTGRQADLLGTGSTSVRFSTIGSFEQPRASHHLNAGFSFGGFARELTLSAASAVAAAGTLTLTGELLGRWMDSPGGITPVSVRHPVLEGVQTQRLVPSGSTLAMLTVAPGFKWNVTDTWVLVGNVGIPVTSGGLTASFTPFVGIDYAFEL